MMKWCLSIILIFPSVLLPFFSPAALASATDGTIDATSKFAWGQNTGWINFGTTGGNVHVTDGGLTGFAWSENYGWINLNPPKAGVKNDSFGNLSGHAWGENLGYINFSGVRIKPNGVFSGVAAGSGNVGQISFDCTNCQVVTDYRPHVSGGSLISGGGGGGGGGGGAVTSPTPGLLINSGGGYTTSTSVTLAITGGSDTAQMEISNSSDFRGAAREPYRQTRVWNLCGSTQLTVNGCPEGTYSIYVRFYNIYGQPMAAVSSSIIYSKNALAPSQVEGPPAPPPPQGPVAIRKPSLPERISQFFKNLLPNLFGEPAGPPPPSPADFVTRQAPLAMGGAWELISRKAVGDFVLAPLPKSITIFAGKFPQLQKLFAEAGIVRQRDLEKLRDVTLKLPGLSEIVALPYGVPLVKFSPEAKKNLPEDVIFVKAGGERIDFDIGVTVNGKGQLEKRVRTLPRTPLELVVKPFGKPKRVTGYIVLRSRPKVSEAGGPFSISSFFARPAFADIFEGDDEYLALESATLAEAGSTGSPQAEKRPAEEKLALARFEFVDKNGDGIYTAEVTAPAVEGEYDIITVIQYSDPDLGAREISLTTVVDPEGYIYELSGGKETRIPNVSVSLYVLDRATGQYRLWPASEYLQENPQKTDVRGSYAYLVPQGTYLIKAEAEGYLPYASDPFDVREGSGVHQSIELRPKFWFLTSFDWKTTLILITILFLAYNFWRDIRRDRKEKEQIRPISQTGPISPIGLISPIEATPPPEEKLLPSSDARGHPPGSLPEVVEKRMIPMSPISPIEQAGPIKHIGPIGPKIFIRPSKSSEEKLLPPPASADVPAVAEALAGESAGKLASVNAVVGRPPAAGKAEPPPDLPVLIIEDDKTDHGSCDQEPKIL